MQFVSTAYTSYFTNISFLVFNTAVDHFFTADAAGIIYCQEHGIIIHTDINALVYVQVHYIAIEVSPVVITKIKNTLLQIR
eukprot:4905300-Ditylum_brightwellii.AAC.1